MAKRRGLRRCRGSLRFAIAIYTLHPLELGQDDRVVVTRNGRPVAQITRYEDAGPTQRIGVAKGHDLYHDGWDSPEIESEIADTFGIAL